MSTKSTVLIMELCETSLYHVLEYPENYYGLSETEFKSVLRDVGKMSLIALFIEICNVYSLKQKTKTGTHCCSLFDGLCYHRIHDMSTLIVVLMKISLLPRQDDDGIR